MRHAELVGGDAMAWSCATSSEAAVAFRPVSFCELDNGLFLLASHVDGQTQGGRDQASAARHEQQALVSGRCGGGLLGGELVVGRAKLVGRGFDLFERGYRRCTVPTNDQLQRSEEIRHSTPCFYLATALYCAHGYEDLQRVRARVPGGL